MLSKAQELARLGLFDELADLCQDYDCCTVSEIFDLAALLKSTGMYQLAEGLYEKALHLDPSLEWQIEANVASMLSALGQHEAAFRKYQRALKRNAQSKSLRRSLILAAEYSPFLDAQQRFELAVEWGNWVESHVGKCSRPNAYQHKKLRVGYVSADICQHTVGLLAKDVITSHRAFEAYVYSDTQQLDWVTNIVLKGSKFRDVRKLSDQQLAALIQHDEIDILVDLSGHTAGSRLTVFALRPAPVQISWLGYFATTGLSAIDAIFLDSAHAPASAVNYFSESIKHLRSRMFYKPVPWAPKVSTAPCLANGYVTFGSFNNTAKFNQPVYETWIEVLLAVPRSRLILKWRSFNDQAFKRNIEKLFIQRGVSSDRIELRGPSFHNSLLKEYSEIDIALDPFPFTGGITTFEALWMGVPVITHPMERAVSRQSLSVLTHLGLESELVADSVQEYVAKAVSLAQKPEKLAELRASLRQMMIQSQCTDLPAFIEDFEATLMQTYQEFR